MDTQENISITIVLAALFAYINHRVIKWPPTIGIMALSLICSVILVALGNSKSLLSAKAIESVMDRSVESSSNSIYSEAGCWV